MELVLYCTVDPLPLKGQVFGNFWIIRFLFSDLFCSCPLQTRIWLFDMSQSGNVKFNTLSSSNSFPDKSFGKHKSSSTSSSPLMQCRMSNSSFGNWSLQWLIFGISSLTSGSIVNQIDLVCQEPNILPNTALTETPSIWQWATVHDWSSFPVQPYWRIKNKRKRTLWGNLAGLRKLHTEFSCRLHSHRALILQLILSWRAWRWRKGSWRFFHACFSCLSKSPMGKGWFSLSIY